ncbi:hypothetical protein Lalb_Chr09g0335481 [Lupinus albus]|uniref:Retrotransposon gag domain-containing protein n=1 Tax=Lupinus albus TaxID=3870 RepID=A0A6A4Q2R8_LUPAL|nr:hypothetical protein Lalb_Chr09g0335481 [Lupinus albus]
MEMWARLRDIFQDYQHPRVVTLEQDFSTTRMEDFPNASAYCQRLKMLSDQLKNVGAPVSNQRLVLQLVSGLTDAYKGVATLIRQSNPLPPFYQARSMLTLEEAGLIKMAATRSNTAMVATQSKNFDELFPSSENSSHNRGGKKGGHWNHPNTSNRNNNRSASGGRSDGKGGCSGRGSNQQHQQ